MAQSKITIIGMYNYFNSYKRDLFELLTVPEGIDRDVLIDNILLKSGDFEVIYSNGDFVHDAIGIWSKKWERTFVKWVKALSVEYNPLENYDRMEEITTTDDGSNTAQGRSGNTNKISAYNSSNFENDTNSDGDFSSSGTAKNRNVRSGRMHGNIGVTTSQQMLEAELNIDMWNIYEHITDIFLKEFIVPIY